MTKIINQYRNEVLQLTNDRNIMAQWLTHSMVAGDNRAVSEILKLPVMSQKLTDENGKMILKILGSLVKNDQNFKIVDLVLSKYNMLVKLTNSVGDTLLHYASSYGAEKTVEVLLKKGADVRQVDMAGNTSLHLASAYGQVKVVEVLATKFTLNLSNNLNLTALDLAILGDKGEVIKALRNIEKSSRIKLKYNVSNLSFKTPLELSESAAVFNKELLSGLANYYKSILCNENQDNFLQEAISRLKRSYSLSPKISKEDAKKILDTLREINCILAPGDNRQLHDFIERSAIQINDLDVLVRLYGDDAMKKMDMQGDFVGAVEIIKNIEKILATNSAAILQATKSFLLPTLQYASAIIGSYKAGEYNKQYDSQTTQDEIIPEVREQTLTPRNQIKKSLTLQCLERNTQAALSLSKQLFDECEEFKLVEKVAAVLSCYTKSGNSQEALKLLDFVYSKHPEIMMNHTYFLLRMQEVMLFTESKEFDKAFNSVQILLQHSHYSKALENCCTTVREFFAQSILLNNNPDTIRLYYSKLFSPEYAEKVVASLTRLSDEVSVNIETGSDENETDTYLDWVAGQVEDLHEALIEYSPQKIHAYYQKKKQELKQELIEYNLIPFTTSWHIGNECFNDTTVHKIYNKPHFYAVIEPTMNLEGFLPQFTEALPNVVKGAGQGQTGNRFIKNNLVELKINDGKRLYATELYKNSKGDYLIVYNHAEKHDNMSNIINHSKIRVIDVPLCSHERYTQMTNGEEATISLTGIDDFFEG